MKKLLTNKQILCVFLPLMFQQLIMNILSLIDNFMIGRFNDAYISGITIVNRVFNISNSLLMGLIASCAVFIAQYYGSNDRENMNRCLKLSIVVSMALLVPLIIMGILWPEQVIELFTKDPVIVETASLYMRFVSWSMIPYVIAQSISNALRSIGYIKGTLRVTCLIVILKVILNIVFTYYPLKLELFGAGLALVITRMAELLLLVIVLNTSQSVLNLHEAFKLSLTKDMIIKVLKKMLPLGTNEFLFGIGLSIIYIQYATYSTSTLAGYSIATTYFDIFRVIFASIGMTMNVFVLPELGTEQFAAAKSKAGQIIRFGVNTSMLFASVFFVSSFTVPWIYNTSADSLAIAQSIIRIMALLFPLTTLHNLFYFIFRCGQDNKSILMIDSFFILFLEIPLQYFLIHIMKLNIQTVYVVIELFYILKCLMAIHFLKKERWIRNLTVN